MNLKERREHLRNLLEDTNQELFYQKFGLGNGEDYHVLRTQQKALMARIALINFQLTGELDN